MGCLLKMQFSDSQFRLTKWKPLERGPEMCIFKMYTKGALCTLNFEITELEVCLSTRKKNREIPGTISGFFGGPQL